ncbi:MAG TPA: glycosyltransferase family 2 protein [Candidatus Ozemobacteraceae bacterium]|nr:glycosyltransferase family 2 protein [Candidatus Ozemobacteraceae bacterium]
MAESVKTVEYTVTAPVYNESENIGELVERISAAMSPIGKPWELVLVDDGSSDGSFELMKRLKDRCPELRALRLNGHHGQTAAMDAGIKAAHGNIIITMDADLQNDPADIPKLVGKLGEFDAAVGWRVVRQDDFVRRVSSKIANWIRNRLSDENIRDTGCSLKAFRRDSIRRARLYEGLHRFLPTLVKMEGGTVTEVEVSHHPRSRGQSKYNVWNRLFRSFLDLLAIRWMKWRKLTYKVADEA